MKVWLLFALVAVAFSQPLEESNHDLQEWEEFKVKYGRKYETAEEEDKRKALFMNSLNFVREHNAMYARGETTSEVAINHLSDLTKEEISAGWKGLKIPSDFEFKGTEFVPPPNVKINSTVDWRKLGAVTPVKNQGSCGSCWAFSTTGVIEGQHFLATKKLISLSEQDLVDCSPMNGGCWGGGYPFLAYEDIIRRKGIDTEESYPYVDKEESCKFKSENIGATISSYKNITSGNETQLKLAVATIGPISVAIDAQSDAFNLHKSGVLDDPDCGKDFHDLSHAVLVVGYGTYKGKDYWLVKNSYGTEWGDEGYIMMSRNKDNQCGIATLASYPVL